MKQIQRTWIAARIEIQWAYILWYRRRGEFLIRRGVPFHSKIFQKLSRKIDRHGLIAFRLQDQYETLFALSCDRDSVFFIVCTVP